MILFLFEWMYDAVFTGLPNYLKGCGDTADHNSRIGARITEESSFMRHVVFILPTTLCFRRARAWPQHAYLLQPFPRDFFRSPLASFLPWSGTMCQSMSFDSGITSSKILSDK
jgi:hypothetical protein